MDDAQEKKYIVPLIQQADFTAWYMKKYNKDTFQVDQDKAYFDHNLYNEFLNTPENDVFGSYS